MAAPLIVEAPRYGARPGRPDRDGRNDSHGRRRSSIRPSDCGPGRSLHLRRIGCGSDGAARSATEVLDLREQTVLPGLIDAHLHLTNLGLNVEQVRTRRRARSVEELVERTAAFARTTCEPWILGRGWDQNLWARNAFPTHEALSAAIPDRPVALARVDGHALLANARAMSLAGIDESTPAPPGGRIARDARGKPTGIFVDAALRWSTIAFRSRRTSSSFARRARRRRMQPKRCHRRLPSRAAATRCWRPTPN